MDSEQKIEVTVNENEHSFNAETNVQQLLEELKTSSNGIAIAINEHVIPKKKRRTRRPGILFLRSTDDFGGSSKN